MLLWELVAKQDAERGSWGFRAELRRATGLHKNTITRLCKQPKDGERPPSMSLKAYKALLRVVEPMGVSAEELAAGGIEFAAGLDSSSGASES